jgi:hypothetical protein
MTVVGSPARIRRNPWADGIVCGLLQLMKALRHPDIMADKRAEDRFHGYPSAYTVVNKDNVAEYEEFMNTYLATKYPG